MGAVEEETAKGVREKTMRSLVVTVARKRQYHSHPLRAGMYGVRIVFQSTGSPDSNRKLVLFFKLFSKASEGI